MRDNECINLRLSAMHFNTMHNHLEPLTLYRVTVLLFHYMLILRFGYKVDKFNKFYSKKF